jgi:quinolinate synthase
MVQKNKEDADLIVERYRGIELAPERNKALSKIEQTLIFENCYSGEQIIDMVRKLKVIDYIRKRKKVKIFAHYYQIPPIQEIADIVADSLKLAQEAQKLEGVEMLVSCTVDFMAEQSKILRPDMKIVLPDTYAGCSIAEGMSGKTVRKIREKFPDSKIVSYINVRAGVKAEVDSLCTSANATEIVERIGGKQVIMLPDYFFSTNIMNRMKTNGRQFIAYRERSKKKLLLEDVHTRKEFEIETDDTSILPRGVCFVHDQFKPNEITELRKKHGVKLVMAHPEVNPNVAEVADYIGGTSGMIKYVEKTGQSEYIVLTECDLTWPLIKAYPDKKFHTPCTICPHMKRNSIDGLLISIEREKNVVEIDPKISERAKASFNKMFELAD